MGRLDGMWRRTASSVRASETASVGTAAVDMRGIRQEVVDRCDHECHALSSASDAQLPSALTVDCDVAGYSPSDGGGGE